MLKHLTHNVYLDLLRSNKNFRQIFIARTTSLLGDWFNTIAIFSLLANIYNQAALAFGTVLIIKVLPNTLLATFAGSIADRRSKTKVMIFSDLSRCAICMCFLIAAFYPQGWIIYLLLTLQTALGTFFEPAKSALIPSIVSKEKLLVANVINSAMWSTMLTFGAAIGGIATEYLGWETVVCIDAATYLVSAWFVSRVKEPNINETDKNLEEQVELKNFKHVKEGLRYLKSEPDLLFMTCIKGLYCIGGAISLLHAVYGDTVFKLGSTIALGVGTLYAARGLGTGLGPIISRAISGDNEKSMRIAIGCGFFVVSGFYYAFSYCDSILPALLCVFLAHTGSSTLWVFSTVLLQQKVDSKFRGRVFGVEMAMFTLTMSVSTLIYSLLLQHNLLSPQEVAKSHAYYWIIPGVLWLAWSLTRLGKKQELM